jgi:hypothetical protein
MIEINYQKRKNGELFKSLENKETLFLSKCQNYIPTYNRFFALNETNYNSINLNQPIYLKSVNKKLVEYGNGGGSIENSHVFECSVERTNTGPNGKTIHKKVFFKEAPLLDPYKYMIGKYEGIQKNGTFLSLPVLKSDEEKEWECNPRLLDPNNSSYVDGFFLYLTSHLFHNEGFIHGIDYYGSFLSIKNDFKVNIIDDLDCLVHYDYFNKNKNVLFQVDDYSKFMTEGEEEKRKVPLNIGEEIDPSLDMETIQEDLFDDVFEQPDTNNDENNIILLTDSVNDNDEQMSLNSGSSSSSRSSYTDTDVSESESESESDSDADTKSTTSTEYSTIDSEYDEKEEKLYVTIPQFPIHLISMEFCENTFDSLIMERGDLPNEEWLSAFMQIIMILITYQKVFSFIHNDLHTNNVMYNNTTEKFVYYLYNGKYYRVPTYGRIYKIIDFGRSIYKFSGNLFFSDHFKRGEEAHGQYNTEPFFNPNKPRIEANSSFDLCRLACSIFNYIIDNMRETRDLTKLEPYKRIVVEWCLDDNDNNVLYKKSGEERYPDFKLYKMISRCCHRHIPSKQLERSEFRAYEIPNKKLSLEIQKKVINIDKMKSLV